MAVKKAKPAAKKPLVKKAEPAKKKAEKKPAKKETPKKAAKPAVKKVLPEPKEATRTYHVVKRKDGKWEVKFAGGQKAIKLFDTQKEAIDYSKIMAKNQGGSMLVHNSKGQNKGGINIFGKHFGNFNQDIVMTIEEDIKNDL